MFSVLCCIAAPSSVLCWLTASEVVGTAYKLWLAQFSLFGDSQDSSQNSLGTDGSTEGSSGSARLIEQRVSTNSGCVWQNCGEGTQSNRGHVWQVMHQTSAAARTL